MINKIIAIYPGRFQPFGKHHAAVFLWVKDKFGANNSFIATSNITDNIKNPFTFKEKQVIIGMYGFEKNLRLVKNPYKPDEILNKFNPKTTAVVYILGEKDAGRLSMTKYFRPYKDKMDLEPFETNGYVLIAPNVSIKIPGSNNEMSGTVIRKMLGNKSKTKLQKKELFNRIFGWYSTKLSNYIMDKLEKMNINEDKLPGGLSDGKTIKDFYEKYDPKQKYTISEFKNIFLKKLKKGIKVEMEHTDDINIAKEIAMDHLYENFQYYELLQKANIDENKLFSKDYWKNILLESNLVDFATEEVTRAGLLDDDSDYNGLIGKAVIELVKVFAEQGHSGFSAAWVRELFNKVGNYENLTPIKDDESEWNDVSESNESLYQSKRNPAVFCTNVKDRSTWYHVDGKELYEYIENNKDLLLEGGVAGHMLYVFELPNVKTGMDLLKTYKQTADYLNTTPASIKVDGINISIKLVNNNGKKEFALDRGSNRDLDKSGVTIDKLKDRFDSNHGMIPIMNKVLTAFNKSITLSKEYLVKLGLWDNPNILLNIEYVSNTINVTKFNGSFITIHNLIETSIVNNKRSTKEISYNKKDLNDYADAIKPIFTKSPYNMNVYTDIKTEVSKPIKFNSLDKNITINLKSDKSVTKKLKEWISKVNIPTMTDPVKWNGQKVPAMKKQIFVDILNGANILEIAGSASDAKKVINAFITWKATLDLGNDILSSLHSDIGKANEQEGIVIRDPNIYSGPFKIVGDFIIRSMNSPFKKQSIKEGGHVFKTGNVSDTRRIRKDEIEPTVKELEKVTNLPLSGNLLGSAGIKPDSSDIDIAMDESKISKDKLISILHTWTDSRNLESTKYIKKSGDSVHFKFPINGDDKNGFVQIDFMFGNPIWMKFALSGAPADSKYKAVHRHVLLSSIATFKNLKWSTKYGLVDRKTDKVITTNPDKIANILLGSEYKGKDLLSVESILMAIQDSKDKDKMIQQAKDTLNKVYNVQL